MIPSRLVQRLRPPYAKGSFPAVKGNPFAFGGGLKNGGLSDDANELLMDYFSFDYMGAAEFEWGAVPDAIAKILEKIDQYAGYTLTIAPDYKVYTICNSADVKEVFKRITRWANEDYSTDLLEQPYLYKALHYADDLDRDAVVPRVCGWIELNNGFFFFTFEEMYRDVCMLFEVEYSD